MYGQAGKSRKSVKNAALSPDCDNIAGYSKIVRDYCMYCIIIYLHSLEQIHIFTENNLIKVRRSESSSCSLFGEFQARPDLKNYNYES